jgi:hypothetical protein
VVGRGSDSLFLLRLFPSWAAVHGLLVRFSFMGSYRAPAGRGFRFRGRPPGEINGDGISSAQDTSSGNGGSAIVAAVVVLVLLAFGGGAGLLFCTRKSVRRRVWIS